MTTTASIPDTFRGTFGCGHEGEVSLEKVPPAKRFARIRFLKTKGQCRACFAKSREKDRRAEDAKVGQWAREQGLPTLHGSEKQVRFGNAVRQRLVVEAYEQLVQDGGMSEEDWLVRVQSPVEVVTSAHWWVEVKDTAPDQLPVVLKSAEEIRAAAWEEATGAAPIRGTEAQVGWAARVRYQLVEDARAHFTSRGMGSGDFREQVEEPASRINAARWWLDLVDAPGEALPALIADAGHDAYVENDL